MMGVSQTITSSEEVVVVEVDDGVAVKRHLNQQRSSEAGVHAHEGGDSEISGDGGKARSLSTSSSDGKGIGASGRINILAVVRYVSGDGGVAADSSVSNDSVSSKKGTWSTTGATTESGAMSAPAKEDVSSKNPSRKKSAGVVIRDTPGVSVSKKKAQAKVDRGKGIDLLSDVALLEAAQLKKVLKKSNGDDDDSNDDDNDNNSNDDGNNEQSDDDHEQADAERTIFDDEEEETQDDEYVYTPEHYVPIEDETNNESDNVTEEEYERINKELYGDVNVSLTDAKPSNQVKDDAQATQKTEGPIPSSSISSDYAAKYLNFNNIPSVDNKVVSMLDINIQYEVPRTSPLLTIPVFVIPEHTVVNLYEIVIIALSTTISSLLITNLEKDVKELKTVDHYATLLSTIKSEVLNAVKEYLGTSLDDALHMVLQKHSADITKEYSVPVEIVERLRQQYVPEKSTEEIKKIKMEHA
ncbi:hypothetical protein Tco_0429633 [Tanacetum coccineum]